MTPKHCSRADEHVPDQRSRRELASIRLQQTSKMAPKRAPDWANTRGMRRQAPVATPPARSKERRPCIEASSPRAEPNCIINAPDHNYELDTG